jgi:formylmethanofuran dehydrogenase subunit E
MKIRELTFDEYLEKVKEFHGSLDPGVVAGAVMLDLAKANLPEGESFDVICETCHSLPDAVQILMPCTTGNGRLKVVETSRFAITVYESGKGEGIRVFLDLTKLDIWPEIRSWLLKERPRHKPDNGLIIEELKEAGDTIFSLEHVRLKPEVLESWKRHGYTVKPCPGCGEAYRSELGDLCPACRGKGPYIDR